MVLDAVGVALELVLLAEPAVKNAVFLVCHFKVNLLPLEQTGTVPTGGGATAAVPGNHGRQNGLLDIVRLRDLYRTLTALPGSEDELERLNLLLRQRFLIVTPMSAFLQGLTNDLLYSLVSRDIEIGKQAVQLAGIGE